MSPATNEKTQALIRTWMPIIVLAVSTVIWCIRLEGKIDTHIAVDTQDALHTKETMEEIKLDVKDIKKDFRTFLSKMP